MMHSFLFLLDSNQLGVREIHRHVDDHVQLYQDFLVRPIRSTAFYVVVGNFYGFRFTQRICECKRVWVAFDGSTR